MPPPASRMRLHGSPIFSCAAIASSNEGVITTMCSRKPTVFSFAPHRRSRSLRRLFRSVSVLTIPVQAPGRKFSKDVGFDWPANIKESIPLSPDASSPATPHVHPMIPPPRSIAPVSIDGAFAESLFATPHKSISTAPAKSLAISIDPALKCSCVIPNPARVHRSHAASRSVTATITLSMQIIATVISSLCQHRVGLRKTHPRQRLIDRFDFSSESRIFHRRRIRNFFK